MEREKLRITDIMDSLVLVSNPYECKGRKAFYDHVCLKVPGQGYLMEFGVSGGESINYLSSKFKRDFYGFDSFEGLPEEWVLTDKKNIVKQGTFKRLTPPKVNKNVRLVIGRFEDTLVEWKQNHKKDIALLHIDCDIYNSTIYVLEKLNSRIHAGTIIIFDELYPFRNLSYYMNWKEHEWKALNEWMIKYKRCVSPVCRTHLYSAALMVTK